MRGCTDTRCFLTLTGCFQCPLMTTPFLFTWAGTQMKPGPGLGGLAYSAVEIRPISVISVRKRLMIKTPLMVLFDCIIMIFECVVSVY